MYENSWVLKAIGYIQTKNVINQERPRLITWEPVLTFSGNFQEICKEGRKRYANKRYAY